ncbi:MAG TPA: LOG family protein [Gammaproteobacteria bacterium]|nr:LOG family protein [Gammaproteobacteria bacterium]
MNKLSIAPPLGRMDLLTMAEASQLVKSANGHLAPLLRDCALAVLSCGSHADDANDLLASNQNFKLEVVGNGPLISFLLTSPPPQAFVDGEIIEGIREHLYAVLRDIIYVSDKLTHWRTRGDSASDITFRILRNTKLLDEQPSSPLAVCWGGHAISEHEYDYTKEVGYQLGLRGFDICTGCGTGAMKGPMKGAAIAHAKQRRRLSRYIGISEPGIIAAESPNAIVNNLVVMPDIEKRLESFVRLAHGIVVFPGGVGTAEEVLYLLCILLNEKNRDQLPPVLLTGPESARAYFESLEHFIVDALGEKAKSYYKLIIGDPAAAVRYLAQNVIENPRPFNWDIEIQKELQIEFYPSHDNVAKLKLSRSLTTAQLAINLRQVFSAIVAGNVKPSVIRSIQSNGRFKIHGDADIMMSLDTLLAQFIKQGRMKVSGQYEPRYEIV